MTYRANDMSNTFDTNEVSAPVRHLRRRRRSLAMSHRTSGVSVSGFGI